MFIPLWRQKFFWIATWLLFYSLFYIYPNLHPLREPQFLPLLAIDEWIPLIPWTFVVYLSIYIYFLMLISRFKDLAQLHAWIRTAFGVLFICGTFYFLFPTTYPRPVYPEVGNAIVHFCMNLVGQGDSPNNCFPSHHIALAGTAIWAARVFPVRERLLYWVWGAAIFVTTLTTKQHYFVDILGGIAVTVTVVSLEWALFQKKVWQSLRAWASQ